MSEQDALHEGLRQAWAEARAGRGGVVHLVGASGVGKTALLDRFVREVGPASDAATVLRARCADRRPRAGGVGRLEALVRRVAEGLRAIGTPEAQDEVAWLLPGGPFLDAAADLAALPAPEGEAEPTSRARVHADLLLDLTRRHPVLFVVDDAQRADSLSRALVETLVEVMADAPGQRLLLVLASAPPFVDPEADGPEPEWRPAPAAVVAVEGPAPQELERRVHASLGRFGEPDPVRAQHLLETAAGNPRILDAALRVAEDSLRADPKVDLRTRPALAGLALLAQSQLPELAPHIRADMQAAAMAGRTFDVDLLSRLWQVPVEAAGARVEALGHTGLVVPRGERWAFLSEALAASLRDTLPAQQRRSLHTRIGALLRARARGAPKRNQKRPIDVTETWSDSRRRERRVAAAEKELWAAVLHFAEAERPAAAAEAAVALVERLVDTEDPFLAARSGRRADRARRHRLASVLDEADRQLELAKAEGGEALAEHLGIHLRLLCARARFARGGGDLGTARRAADAAWALAGHVSEARLRLLARRVRLEVCYAAGDHNAARQSLVVVMGELERAQRDDAVPVYAHLAESVGRSEWAGLQPRLLPLLLERLAALGAHREALDARLEMLAGSFEGDPATGEPLLAAAIDEAHKRELLPYLGEQLALHAGELVALTVDLHYDSLSGEFYPPDLEGAEPLGPAPVPLRERLLWPEALLARAEVIAEECRQQVTHLRVLTTMLGVVHEVRERLAELIDRWRQPGHPPPPRLDELVDILDHGFFDVENLEGLAQRTIELAQKLGLDQVLADTVYDCLDRDLPSAVKRGEELFRTAGAAYDRVGDAYGRITLALVQVRYARREGEAPDEPLGHARELLARNGESFEPEQAGYIHLRLGELLVQAGEPDAATDHFEAAMNAYDRAGSMAQLQRVVEILRDVYRRQGDLGRYRSLRDRFQALDNRNPGVDPLGLEMRVDHLLTLARQEPDEERAIEMVERCVQLLARLPDTSHRIDECFVEISKICRRRAEGASSEAGYEAWLRRSLDAVRMAATVNREMGNLNRLFEEFHELFDDLLGLGAWPDYLRARAECRELAFDAGHVGELLYLFEEHMQADPQRGFNPEGLPELRGFFEALMRYLVGLGTLEKAEAVRRGFVEFLGEVGEAALAEEYRARRF